MQFSLLPPEEARWTRVLERCENEFYHWPDYVRLEAQRQGGEAGALWAHDEGQEWLLPVVIRPLDGVPDAGTVSSSWRDAVSPYGYPHPLTLAAPEQRERFLRTVLAALRRFLCEEKILTLFVRCSPLQALALAYSECGHLVEHGPCFWLDLTESQEELHGQMRSRYRSYLNALRRDGVEARFVPVTEKLDAFIELYYRTMDRVRAARWYYFDRDYFQELTRILGASLKMCVVESGDALLAAGLFVSSGGVTQYLLSGIDEALGQPHATKLMMVHVRDHAKEAGDRAFHLGGGLGGGEDMLSQFKRGFTRHSSPFLTWRLVADEAAYSALIDAWGRTHGVPADGLGGYFPAYRKPAPTDGAG